MQRRRRLPDRYALRCSTRVDDRLHHARVHDRCRLRRGCRLCLRAPSLLGREQSRSGIRDVRPRRVRHRCRLHRRIALYLASTPRRSDGISLRIERGRVSKPQRLRLRPRALRARRFALHLRITRRPRLYFAATSARWRAFRRVSRKPMSEHGVQLRRVRSIARGTNPATSETSTR